MRALALLLLLTVPALAKAGALLSLGWSAAFAKQPVLTNRLAGTPLQLRGNGKHYYVKIGDKKSMYAAAEVR